MPPVKVDRVLHDKDEVRLGGVKIVKIVAYRSPGHSPATQPMHGKRARMVTPIRWCFRARRAPNATTLADPKRVEDYRYPSRVLKSLPCDVYVGAHGKFFDLREKCAQLQKEGANLYIDSNGYQVHIKLMEQSFYYNYKLDAAQRQATH